MNSKGKKKEKKKLIKFKLFRRWGATGILIEIVKGEERKLFK